VADHGGDDDNIIFDVVKDVFFCLTLEGSDARGEFCSAGERLA